MTNKTMPIVNRTVNFSIQIQILNYVRLFSDVRAGMNILYEISIHSRIPHFPCVPEELNRGFSFKRNYFIQSWVDFRGGRNDLHSTQLRLLLNTHIST